MRLNFIVIRKTVYSSCAEIDEHMMTQLYTMLISRSRHTLSLEVSSAYQTRINIIISQRDAADLLEVKIDEVALYCWEVRALLGDDLLRWIVLHLL
jgi:hypothetical protein